MNTPQSDPVASFLSQGLLKGFAGKTEFKTIQRSSFTMQSSHLVDGENLYHDEWAANLTGGGQELVRVAGREYTRVYAGGTISESVMAQMGISKKDVMQFLISSLNTAGEATRLHQDYGPVSTDGWTYHYTVLEKNDSIPMTTGKESISYKNEVVFIHVFVLCPIM